MKLYLYRVTVDRFGRCGLQSGWSETSESVVTSTMERAGDIIKGRFGGDAYAKVVEVARLGEVTWVDFQEVEKWKL